MKISCLIFLFCSKNGFNETAYENITVDPLTQSHCVFLTIPIEIFCARVYNSNVTTVVVDMKNFHF